MNKPFSSSAHLQQINQTVRVMHLVRSTCHAMRGRGLVDHSQPGEIRRLNGGSIDVINHGHIDDRKMGIQIYEIKRGHLFVLKGTPFEPGRCLNHVWYQIALERICNKRKGFTDFYLKSMFTIWP